MSVALINGVKLYYEVTGDGFPIVFCHGYKGCHFDFAYQVPLLSRKYKVITFDHRGHCLSEAPSDKKDYSIPLFAQDMKALLEFLHIQRCILVGHSMGGFVALQFIKDYPDMVNALVLIGTCARLEDMEDYDRLMRKIGMIARQQGMEAAFEQSIMYDPMTRQFLQKYPERREIIKQQWMNLSVDTYIYTWEAIVEWEGVLEYLPGINVPTIIFLGEEDTSIMKMTQKMADLIPNARLSVIPNVGHSPQEYAPYTFNIQLMQFLSNLH